MLPERIAEEVHQVSDFQLHFFHLVDSKSELPGFLVEVEFLLVLAAIVGLYILSAETVKRVFYQYIRA